MGFITFFIVAVIVIIVAVFLGGVALAGLPILIFVGIPLFVLWLLIYHTVIGMIVGVVILGLIAVAKAGKS